MPLEIRELVIRVNVQENPGNKEKEPISTELKQEIIDECKAELIAYLERQAER